MNNEKEIFSFNDGLQLESYAQKILNQFYESQNWTYHRNSDKKCKTSDLIILNTTVEEKYRPVDWNDFLIEIVQDVASKNEGWFYTSTADRIFYVVALKKIYSIKWKQFKNWFKEHWKDIDTRIGINTSIKGYGLTINITIPWFIIPPELYKIIPLEKENDDELPF